MGRPVAEVNDGPVTVSPYGGDGRLQAKVNAVLPVEGRERGRHHVTQNSAQRHGCRLDDDDSRIVVPRRGRGFKADPARPDDQDRPCETGLQGERVLEGTKGHHQTTLDAREPARDGARREDQLVVRDGLVTQHHLLGAPVDRRCAGARPDRHVVVGIPGLVEGVDRVWLGVTEEESLRERRSFVREMRLSREDGDGPGVALGAEPLSHVGGRKATSDDDDCVLAAAHGGPLPFWLPS